MNVRINFHPAPRREGRRRKIRKHSLPQCETTRLARYRDRHQARDGASALNVVSPDHDVTMFACPDCRGWHVEKHLGKELIPTRGRAVSPQVSADSAYSRTRRYFVVDIENPTRGAKASREDAAELWRIIRDQAPGVTPHDHVVVGASRSVARKYAPVIAGHHVRWVVGANAPDAADRALLGAVDVRRVARRFDELVIVSGDHAFSDLARQAKAAGLTVHVVTAQQPGGRPMLSRELAAIADTRTLLPLVRLHGHETSAGSAKASRTAPGERAVA